MGKLRGPGETRRSGRRPVPRSSHLCGHTAGCSPPRREASLPGQLSRAAVGPMGAGQAQSCPRWEASPCGGWIPTPALPVCGSDTTGGPLSHSEHVSSSTKWARYLPFGCVRNKNSLSRVCVVCTPALSVCSRGLGLGRSWLRQCCRVRHNHVSDGQRPFPGSLSAGLTASRPLPASDGLDNHSGR